MGVCLKCNLSNLYNSLLFDYSSSLNYSENPTQEERERKIAKNKDRWGLGQEEIDAIELPKPSVAFGHGHKKVMNEFEIRMLKGRLVFLRHRLQYLESV